MVDGHTDDCSRLIGDCMYCRYSMRVLCCGVHIDIINLEIVL